MARFDLSLDDHVGLAAGVLILAIGIFVIAARPHSLLHRLFFLLALMDGMSTLLFGLAFAATEPGERAYFWATYYYHFLAFIGLLAIFGVEFPTPPANPRRRFAALTLATGGTAVALAAYVMDHGWFFASVGSLRGAGDFVNVAFVLIVAGLVLRFTRAVLQHPSPSHRRQAGYVLGGMSIAYAPFPTTVLIQAVAQRGAAPLASGSLGEILSYWAFVATLAAVVGSLALVARANAREPAPELRFVLGAHLGVIAITLLALAFPTPEFVSALQAAALLIYPVLLGFAIVRYEVFDIDRRLRRATTVSLLALAMGGTFISVQSVIEGFLHDSFFGGIPSEFVSNGIAASAATVLGIPLLNAARAVSAKVIPELSVDELRSRKLEIYRHSLAGAYADGIVKEGESRTLAALRETLGITQAEHERLAREVMPA